MPDDPSSRAAARTALATAADDLGVEVEALRVIAIARLRRSGSKAPFYEVTVRGPAGDHRTYRIVEDGTRLEDPRPPQV